MTFSSGTNTLGGTISLSGGVTIASGATVNGSGTITGNLTNNGTLNVGGLNAIGTLTISGNFTQGSSGNLQMDLASSTSYDKLVISGTATLGGTLNVGPLMGYTPASGTSFAILTFASYSGSFSYVMSSLPTKQYNATNFSMVAMAEFDDPAEEPPLEDSPPKRDERTAATAVAGVRPSPAPDAPLPLVVASDLFFADLGQWTEDGWEAIGTDQEAWPDQAMLGLAALPIDLPLAILDALFEGIL